MKKILLTQGQYALVDDADYEELSNFNWYAKWDAHTKSFYAGRYIKIKKGQYSAIPMHRYLLKPQKGVCVDHINHNTLDNRRENLRLATNSQNQQNKRRQKNNTSGYVGVSWKESNKKWGAFIRKDRTLKCLGYYLNRNEAAYAYNLAAKELFGEYAFLNKL